MFLYSILGISWTSVVLVKARSLDSISEVAISLGPYRILLCGAGQLVDGREVRNLLVEQAVSFHVWKQGVLSALIALWPCLLESISLIENHMECFGGLDGVSLLSFLCCPGLGVVNSIAVIWRLGFWWEVEPVTLSFLSKGFSWSDYVAVLQVDPKIMGGFILDIGEKHIDLSILTRVKKVQQLIVEAVWLLSKLISSGQMLMHAGTKHVTTWMVNDRFHCWTVRPCITRSEGDLQVFHLLESSSWKVVLGTVLTDDSHVYMFSRL